MKPDIVISNFHVRTNEGYDVRVKMTQHWFNSPGLIHFEFHGPISETGFRSLFVPFNPKDFPTWDELMASVKEYCAQESPKFWKCNALKNDRGPFLTKVLNSQNTIPITLLING